MASKSSKIFVVVAAVLVVAGYAYSADKDTIFSAVIKPLQPLDWNEVKPKYIVEYSIPITIKEKNGNDCTVDAKRFYNLVTSGKFTKRADLANELKFNYDKKVTSDGNIMITNETLVIPCDKMHEDRSEFTVWFVSSDSSIHKEKYEYYIDPYDGTLGRGVNYFNETAPIVKRLN